MWILCSNVQIKTGDSRKWGNWGDRKGKKKKNQIKKKKESYDCDWC